MTESPYLPPSAPVFGGDDDQEKVRAVAHAQKRVIQVFLTYLGLTALIVALIATHLARQDSPIIMLLLLPFLPLFVFHLISIYKLADALGLSAVGWLLGMLVPYLNLVLYFLLLHKASKYLKEQGVEVGLLGAKR